MRKESRLTTSPGAGFSAGAFSAVAAAGDAGIPELVGLVLPDNVASQRVLERVGFVRVGETVKAGLDHLVYRLKPVG